MRKVASSIYVVALCALMSISAMSLSGCFALLAGTAGGAGTAVWLSNKLVQEVNAPMDRSISAVRAALKSLKLEVTKETQAEDVAQVKSEYYDGKNIWIDIRKVTASKSKIEVRVGLTGDEIAARKVLDAILKRL
ncbi:MAG: DUF3568 domain-containing protein [Candidatus Omnitrophica bacterium]|nr:DUF3568 domain-containing protein [Candidatus Omnitrophota bacterium]